ncbi:MAG: FKBP-type peptidyl-prolyl cis-trans isomerase [Methyloversatilis sp.]|nr:FKBP-type peptidyl-prolyl cis-trans isomerase [Methyloversatilis sp.]
MTAITTESGLVYEDTTPGTGHEAAAGQEVSVHYTGWLTDGRKFDSSKDRNDPFSFQLGAGQVIRGWDEGVAGMKEGGVRKLTIPPELGYGARGAGGVIPPNATLVFEVELLAVVRNEGELVIEELTPGTGKEAQPGQRVTVHYTGWLTDGRKFDSSKDRKQPFSFHLGAGQVIRGWDEGVAGMKEGGVRKLTIPAHLGYGRRGAGGVIPPNATLVFEVELLSAG